jgi:hypothetical protein
MRRKLVFLLALAMLWGMGSSAHAVVTRVEKGVKDYSGIGVIWVRNKSGLKVVTIFRNSPASGQMQVGDIIKEINGIPVYSQACSDLIERMSDEPGTQAEFSILRHGINFTRTITSNRVEIRPSNIEVTTMPLGKITTFLTEQYFYCDLNTSDEVRSGDQFLVFEGDIPVGIARVREASYHHTELTMIKFFTRVVTRNKEKYTLIFFKYSPISYLPTRKK